MQAHACTCARTRARTPYLSISLHSFWTGSPPLWRDRALDSQPRPYTPTIKADWPTVSSVRSWGRPPVFDSSCVIPLGPSRREVTGVSVVEPFIQSLHKDQIINTERIILFLIWIFLYLNPLKHLFMCMLFCLRKSVAEFIIRLFIISYYYYIIWYLHLYIFTEHIVLQFINC